MTPPTQQPERDMINLRNQLNEAQFAAATTINGPVLVIAGAGAGKTRVIEFRVLNLVQNNVNAEEILLLTFTRKAAHSMISRAAKHDVRCANVSGGTFHSFALRALREHGWRIGFQDSFVMLDEADSQEAIQLCMTRAGLFDHPEEKRLPKKDTVRAIISMAINKAMPISDILNQLYPHFSEFAPVIEIIQEHYTAYKIDRSYVDFDDLLVYLKLLLKNAEVRRHFAARHKYVMVDEYQDTNPLQADITYLLAQEHQNILVVGDDAQSIYGFRGGSHENILTFPDRFPDCRTITLAANYRSTKQVLDLANAVLANMEHKYTKNLFPAGNQSGEKPRLLGFRDAHEEAEWIGGQITRYHNDDIPFASQAVLVRSVHLSISLQVELNKRGIPYEVWGGRKFHETAHVKDLLVHLKVLVNRVDELAWHRLLRLIDGVGQKTAESLTARIIGCPSLELALASCFPKSQPQAKPLDAGLARLGQVLLAASVPGLAVGEQFGLILDYYEPLLKAKHDDWDVRKKDLETLRQIAMRYTAAGDFLADLALEPPERGVSSVGHQLGEEDILKLSTIHSAKGREWECVFFMGLMDGALPSSRSLGTTEEIEEERRLLYVGVTRAKKHLALTYSHVGSGEGASQFNKLSRFIDRPDVLNHLDRGERRNAPGLDDGITPADKSDLPPVMYDKRSLSAKVLSLIQRGR